MKIAPKKILGQHFLKCHWVGEILIQTANIDKNDSVLEIGPGTGVLTRELAGSAGKVLAIEKDEYLAEELKKSLRSEGIKNVEIIAADILLRLKSDFNQTPYKVVANIPYYLTSRLLRLLLEQKNKPVNIVLTVQKEVAKRITAKPPHLNLLALAIQSRSNPKIIKTVPAECFYPKPKVDSAIISISDISDKFFIELGISPDNLFNIAHTGFGQKRKKLMPVLGKKYGKEKTINAFTASKIHENARPEELTLEQWGNLTKILH